MPILKQGIACRIGDGSSVSITSDPWLPIADDPFIYTVNPAIQNQMVSSLMVVGANQWDMNLIFDVFNESEANVIVVIPLRNDDRDTWYWRGEKSGAYSIKSAYNLIQDSGGKCGILRYHQKLSTFFGGRSQVVYQQKTHYGRKKWSSTQCVYCVMWRLNLLFILWLNVLLSLLAGRRHT